MMIKLENLELELYIVMNEKGQFFRTKGFRGYGESWVEDVQKAKVYPKIGPARSVITFFANKFYPEYPIPNLVKLTVSGAEIIDEADRVKKAMNKKIKEEASLKKSLAEYRLEKAQEDFDKAQSDLEKLKRE